MNDFVARRNRRFLDLPCIIDVYFCSLRPPFSTLEALGFAIFNAVFCITCLQFIRDDIFQVSARVARRQSGTSTDARFLCDNC